MYLTDWGVEEVIKKCKKKLPCDETEFGCCLDGTTAALGPFQKGIL